MNQPMDGKLCIDKFTTRMDVVAMLDFLGLKEADLSRQLTFKAAEGEGPQNLVAHAVYEGT